MRFSHTALTHPIKCCSLSVLCIQAANSTIESREKYAKLAELFPMTRVAGVEILMPKGRRLRS